MSLNEFEQRIAQFVAKRREQEVLEVYGMMAVAKAFQAYPSFTTVPYKGIIIPTATDNWYCEVICTADRHGELVSINPDFTYYVLVTQRGPDRFRIVGYARKADLFVPENLRSEDPDTYVLPQEKLRGFSSWSS